MDNESKQIFTRRLTQSNRSEMIVITYDIYFAYEEDARAASAASSFENYKTAIHKMQETLNELIYSLDFSYGIAKELYSLYRYCNEQLSEALYQNRLDGVENASRVMKQLYQSFVEVSKQDTSAPLMQNVEQVYAGMTYGKGQLNENYVTDNNRGFFV